MSDVRWEPMDDQRMVGDMPDERWAVCRAVPVTWSQEPPTEAGYYEVWNNLWRRGYPENGVTPAELWIDDRYDPPVMMFHMAGEDMYPLSEAPSGTWYKPLRMSQPPGEVTE